MSARGLLAGAILVAWGAGLATLAQRELARTAFDDLADAAMRVSPMASYLLVARGTEHVGFASFTTDTVPDGLQFTNYSVLVGASGERRVLQEVVRTSRALVLRDVVVRNGADSALLQVVDDSVFRLVRYTPDRADTSRHTFTPPLLTPSLVPMVVALGEDRGRGTRRSYQVFDPLQLAVRAAAIRVRAESTWAVVDSAAFDGATSRWAGVHADSLVAWHVVEEAPGGIDAWVDELGQLVERAMPSGERARRTAYEVAFENWRSRDRHPTPTATATREAAFPPRDSLRVVATGLPLDRLQVAHRWQHRAGDTLVAAAPVLPRTGDYALPIPRAVRERFVRELQVEPMIEVEAPAIMGLARRLRAREPHPPTVARRLAEWVADSVADDDTPTPPSAQATARSRAGGQAHRVHLYIALARAAGIPSRAVHGVRLSDRGFVQRIWAESWLGGEWFPVDPLSKRWMTDASYIRLLVGGATLDAEVARLLEHAPLTVLSAGGSSRR